MSTTEAHARMRRIGRIGLICLICAVGAGAVLYGALKHQREVLVTQEVKAPPGFEVQAPGATPWDLVRPQAEKEQTVGIGLSEPTMIRDVTVGGIERLDDGQLKRTYSGKAPALCPT